MVTAPARRGLVWHFMDWGLTERRSLAVVRMRHKRYGVGMIYLKLRQAECS